MGAIRKPRVQPTRSKVVVEAARWLIANRQRLRDEGNHTVPALVAEFRLSTKQAVEAIRQAHAMEARK